MLRSRETNFNSSKRAQLKSVSFQNGALSFQLIPAGTGFNVYLRTHHRTEEINNRIG